jgi:phage baseplate assembly protein gpV
MEVLLWIPQNAATTTGGAISASKVKIKDLKTEMQLANAKLGGVVSKTDTAAKAFYLDAVKVDASAATFAQAGKSFADIKDGVYVRVMGAYQADGTLKANSIVLRAAEEQSSGAVELHGSILNFVSNADFTVRDVHVDASNATIACTPATLANNLQVEIDGQLTANGKVTATAVKCESVQDGQSVVERVGAAAKVDLAAKTLTVTTPTQTLTVQWSSRTVFVGADQSALDGKTIEVEGTLSGGVLRATKIKLVL